MRHTEAVIPLGALVTVLSDLKAMDAGLCERLLDTEGLTLPVNGQHPAARPDGEGHVLVRGPDRFALDYDEEPTEVVHRIPLGAVRKFVLDLFCQPIVSRIGDLDADALGRVAGIVTPAVESLRLAKTARDDGAGVVAPVG